MDQLIISFHGGPGGRAPGPQTVAAWASGHGKAGHSLSHRSPPLPDGAGSVLPEQRLAGLEDGEPLQGVPRLTA